MGRWGDGEMGRFLLSDAAPSRGGFPHERLHQDRVIILRLYNFFILIVNILPNPYSLLPIPLCYRCPFR
ncbi:hypothetical protein [Moorena sp. SIO3H5]|uniref:hypothetical protein n=1 Tax=Moorena sp. SIO3H5 TaxID=2607834 RepID=UPI0013B98CAF|nr:hypothetical protein [Moorena sp. SIO3H5]NEO73725.1 hypothetical protein [Moorena sp. SIO3H5]